MTATAGQARVPILSDDEQDLLLYEVFPFVRTFTLYVLALRVGLGARQLNALNIGDVSPDGRRVRDGLLVRSGSPSALSLDNGARRAVGRYLDWRCSCVHHRLPLQTYRDGAARRCHVCRDDVNTLANPLFIGRNKRRLSAKRMRHEFAERRDELGLDRRLRFDSLRQTYEASRGVHGTGS